MYNKDIMNYVINEAKKVDFDIPVCAIITKNNKIISIKTNEREKTNVCTSHAEILAINDANIKLNNWRLEDCEMYVNLEPCPMCAWAIISSRIKNLYFGSYDNLYGGFSTSLNLKNFSNSKINIQGGMLEEECNKIIENYFKKVRNENRIR